MFKSIIFKGVPRDFAFALFDAKKKYEKEHGCKPNEFEVISGQKDMLKV